MKRSLAILLLLAVALFASGCAMQPNGNWDKGSSPVLSPHAKPPFRDDRKSVERAVQFASQQRYFAALELLEPLRPKPTTTEPAPAAEPRERSELQIHQEAEVTFWIAYCYEKTGRTQDATAMYGQILSDYAATDFATMAKARLEVLAEK